jgi:hypothetical protein
MTLRPWLKALAFWALMLALAFVWLYLHRMGSGSRSDTLIAFGPLAGVIVLFALILGIEIGRNGAIGKA